MTLPGPFTLLVIALSTLLGLAGCSSHVSPVHGKVSVKGGSPPDRAIVVFTDEANHRSASGSVSEDGTYKLTTAYPGDGAPPGKYKVTIYAPAAKDSSQRQPPRPFASRYENAESSGLAEEVKPGRNTFDFELDPPVSP